MLVNKVVLADRSIEEEELDNLIDDKQVIQIFIDNVSLIECFSANCRFFLILYSEPVSAVAIKYNQV